MTDDIDKRSKRFEKMELLLTKKLLKKTEKFLSYHLKEEEYLLDVLSLITSSYYAGLILMLEKITQNSPADIKDKVKGIKDGFKEVLDSGIDEEKI
jgi:CRISPR/Cas system-associated endonuclease Cas3-HD